MIVTDILYVRRDTGHSVGEPKRHMSREFLRVNDTLIHSESMDLMLLKSANEGGHTPISVLITTV